MMKKTELEIFLLVKAVYSLERAINKLHTMPEDEFVRDSCVQRFEYTYELCSKFIRRYLMLTEPSADVVEQMSFPTLIRKANERGLLENDWSVWMEYRDKRNMTSHTYDEKKALIVIQSIPSFLKDVQFFIKKLKENIDL